MQRIEPTVITETMTSGFGEFIERKYTRGKFLGKGGFAKCYEFTCETTKLVYAAKVIPRISLTKTRRRQKVNL